MTIMIVDDNIRFGEMVKRFLSRELPDLSEIYECTDGPEAVKTFERERPDWTIMDIELKTLDGLSAAREIRAIDESARIVILTQYNEPAYHAAAMELGANGFLVKDRLFLLPELVRGDKGRSRDLP